MKYAEVIVFKKAGEFDDALTYALPDVYADCPAGTLVRVPFRKGSVRGMIVRVTDEKPEGLQGDAIRPVDAVLPQVALPPEQIELARFIARFYHTSLTRSLRLMLPKVIWEGKFTMPETVRYRLAVTEPVVRGVKQLAAIDALRRHQGEADENALRAEVEGLSLATLNALVKTGILFKETVPLYKSAPAGQFPLKPLKWILTPDQERALGEISAARKPVLLHGVTGSGKTEIYLRLILESVKAGRQAILLVPEIALTPQMTDYFKDFFGDHVALFHSKLSDNARAAEWWKVATGHAVLVIGSRSAIFAPAANPGLIIIDEEHEWTYKQEQSPHYETHAVAAELARLWSATLLLGSATPRVESFHKARVGEYLPVTLAERVSGAPLPVIHIVDLRDEFQKKNLSIFSLALQNKIRDRLEKKEQVILFVNQRGLARAVVCRQCGYTAECPACGIALKMHRMDSGLRTTDYVVPSGSYSVVRSPEKLICHYCHYTQDPFLLCPTCKSPHIRQVGVGTQRVEEEMHRLFPAARVLRADKDTTEDAKGFEPMYHAFLNGGADVLVGTQMVAKGLDFPNVSLVGLVLADIGLHLPDFRSHERLFQLITQVAGRCGRADKLGEVVLQTYQPDHFTIQKAAQYQYPQFVEDELKFREKLGYPPFNRMIKFTVVGTDEKKLGAHIQAEREVLEDISRINSLDVKISSAPALIARMADRYYFHVLVRAPQPDVIFKHWKAPKTWRIDIDPIHTA